MRRSNGRPLCAAHPDGSIADGFVVITVIQDSATIAKAVTSMQRRLVHRRSRA